MLHPTARGDNDVTVTKLSKPIDKAGSGALRKEFREHARAGRLFHVIDLRELGPIDSPTLAALIAALRIVREKGGDVRLVIAGRNLCEVLRITGLDRVFAVHAAIGEAVVALTTAGPHIPREVQTKRTCDGPLAA